MPRALGAGFWLLSSMVKTNFSNRVVSTSARLTAAKVRAKRQAPAAADLAWSAKTPRSAATVATCIVFLIALLLMPIQTEREGGGLATKCK
jgi:hypothetical protein